MFFFVVIMSLKVWLSARWTTSSPTWISLAFTHFLLFLLGVR